MRARIHVLTLAVEASHERPWGIYSAYFRDPDGHFWEIAWNPAFEPPTA